VRVLHVTPCFPPTWAYGGIPRAVDALTRALAAAGCGVRVWTSDAFDATRRAPVPPRREEAGVDIRVTRLASNGLAWRHQLYLPMGAPPLDDVDVVHLHGHRNLLNWAAWREARRRRRPVVLTAHGTVPRIERKVAFKAVWDAVFDGDVPTDADRVVALSRAEVRSLVRMGVEAARIVRIPNALHLDAFEALPARGRFREAHRIGDGPLVVYLGQITPRKGVDHLVRAWSGMPGTLVVAGEARGMEAPAGAGVVYPGTLEGPERLALLVDADVLVYPSTDEVFGLVPLEGLLCGAPVVVGGDCGCGELIGEAGAGVQVRHGDEAGLRQAIRALLEDRGSAAAMVARGRRYIQENLRPATVAEAHLRLYRELVG
jgi:glycosyltransferase involved in cell wall biosynthesis